MVIPLEDQKCDLSQLNGSLWVNGKRSHTREKYGPSKTDYEDYLKAQAE
jgi:hypothetical protein